MSPLAAVTGGTGFVGRHVVAALAAAGWRLRLLVRRDPRLALGDVAAPVELVPGHLGSGRTDLRALVRGADAVIHLAGAIRGRDRAAFMATNRDGTATLAAAWREQAPQARFVLLSSLAAREPGLSAYAASKAAGETALAAGPDENAVILRPGAVYGPGDRETLSLFRSAGWPVQPMPGGPDARLALIHVADLAAAVLAMAEAAPAPPPGPFELSDARTEGHDWPAILAAACAASGHPCRPVRLPAGLLHLAGWWGDLRALGPGRTPILTSGKRREMLHPHWGSSAAAQPPAALWRPAIPLAQGFADTVAWYRTAGWLPGRN